MYLQSGTTNGNTVQNTVHIGPTNGHSRLHKVNRSLTNGRYVLSRVHIGRNDGHPYPKNSTEAILMAILYQTKSE